MKQYTLLPFAVAMFSLFAAVDRSHSQSTAFTYQGRLNNNGALANGSYDLQFAIFDAPAAGSQIGSPLAANAVLVSNGLFTVMLDFGAGVFTGAERWLNLSVKTNGAVSFTPLTSRQQLTATPYATRAANAMSFTGAVSDAQLSGNVARLNGNQTFSGAVNFNSASNLFAGTFSGNGAGVTNVPGAIPWQTVGDTNVPAQVNMGYVADNPAQVTIALPANPTVGDVVSVYGLGAGGWRIAPAAGQTIVGFESNFAWTPQEANRNWLPVASSADGSKLVTSADSQIYTSTDSGTNWTARLLNYITSFASSADGSKLVGVQNAGQIYTSTDSGTNWTPRAFPESWRSVASSVDGSKLVAVTDGHLIYTSTDSGTNWIARETNRDWYSVASSADGSKLVAVHYNGQIYTSTDSGTNWLAQASNRQWFSVASSADGGKLVALVSNGQIYTSTDSGTNWTARDSIRIWQAVASSADGSKLVAAVSNGQIYTSTDSGTNWIARGSSRFWQSVASSADGSKLVATVYGGQIYTANTAMAIPTPMIDVQGSSVELRYTGGGLWQPLNLAQPVSAPNTTVTRDANGDFAASTITAATFVGDGSTLTGLNGANLQDGSVTAAKIGGALNAAQIPNLDASKITSGTLADARLSTNVALLNANQTFTATNTFAEAVRINGNKTLEFGADVTKESNAGKIGYQTFTADTLDIVGAGTNGNMRKIKFFAEGGATFNGNVTVGAFPIIAVSTISPTAGSTLTPTTGFVKLAPFSPVTLNTPTAIASATTPGTLLILQGTSDVNPVTIKDSANTRLGGGSDRVLGLNDTLTLIWNGSVWVELSFVNN